MGVKGHKTGRGDLGTIEAREFKGARRRITPNSNALSAEIPGGSSAPHWTGRLLGSATPRSDHFDDLSARGRL